MRDDVTTVVNRGFLNDGFSPLNCSAQTYDKVWGMETVIANNDLYCMKKLHLRGGFQSSLHYHKVKDETFYIESGALVLELGLRTITMYPGDFCRIEPGKRHRFSNFNEADCVITEVSTHHSDDDVYRLEESRKL